MFTVIIVLLFVLLAFGVLAAAFRGGFARRVVPATGTQTKGARQATYFGFAVAIVVLGALVPFIVVRAVHGEDDIPGANVSNLTSAEKEGRTLFANRCAACHTLGAVKSTSQVGPNLDSLRPNQALVLNAIAQGRARGNGQMAADIYEGQEARDVAAFVAKAVGQAQQTASRSSTG